MKVKTTVIVTNVFKPSPLDGKEQRTYVSAVDLPTGGTLKFGIDGDADVSVGAMLEVDADFRPGTYNGKLSLAMVV